VSKSCGVVYPTFVPQLATSQGTETRPSASFKSLRPGIIDPFVTRRVLMTRLWLLAYNEILGLIFGLGRVSEAHSLASNLWDRFVQASRLA
jgi:hypothetical protein